MAKKSAPERGAMSSAIREFLTENPNTRNKDVVAALAKKAGPSGQNVSKVLPRHHWPPPPDFCQSRALTSLAQV